MFEENYKNLLRLRMFSNTCCGVSSLNGGIPVINSNKHTPNDHQSTAALCFCLKLNEMSLLIAIFQQVKTYDKSSSGLR